MGEERDTSSTDKDTHCWEKYDPRRDPIEFINLLSLVCLTLGVILIFVGYLYPRDYTLDPHKDAREMEAITIQYNTLTWRLDLCIMLGMVFVGCGAFILTMILTYLFFKGEILPICDSDPDPSEREKLYPMTTINDKSYGTKASESKDCDKTN